MSALEAIEGRTSVRSFQYREVDDALLLSVLKAAVRAPLAVDREPWAFAIVQDRVLLRRISDRAKELWNAEMHRREASSSPDGARPSSRGIPPAETNLFHNAGTLVIVGARSNEPYAEVECWLAAENLMIAATALGLGTCVIGAAVSALSDPTLRSEIGISSTFRPIAPIILGHPRDRPAPTPRREPDVVAWRR
jgi:nitroreductase